MNRKATSTKDADPDLFQHHGIAGNGDSRKEARSHSTGKNNLGKPVACGHAHHARHRATDVIEGLLFPLPCYLHLEFSHFRILQFPVSVSVLVSI